MSITGGGLDPIVARLLALQEEISRLPRAVWATVTQREPLRIHIDGDAQPMASTPSQTSAPPETGSRVLCLLQNGRATIIGNAPPQEIPEFPEIPEIPDIDFEQLEQDVADARDRLDQARLELDSLADGTHPVYTEIQAIEDTLDGTVKVHRTPTRPTGLNDTSDLADLWVNPSDPSDIWRWEGTTTGWVKQDDIDLSEFYARLDAAESALDTLHDTTLPALGDRLDSIDGEVGAAQSGISGLLSRMSTAESDVSAAQSAAAAADAKAVLAQQSADGKSTVTYGASKKASGAAGSAGDTHYVFSGSNLIGVQRHTGSAWVDAEWSHQVIGSIDLGKATVGELHGQYIAARSLTAEKLVISPDNLFPDPFFQSGNWGGTNISVGPHADFPAGNTLQIVGATAQRGSYYNGSAAALGTVQFERGKTYRIRVRARVEGTAGSTLRFYVRGRNASGGWSTYSTIIIPSTEPVTPDGEVREFEGSLSVGNNIVTPQTVGLHTNSPYVAGVTFVVSDVQMQLMSDASLIVDGTILGRHLDVGSVTAKLVETNLLNALTANIQDAWIEQGWIKSLVVDIADVEGLTFTNASGRFLRTELFAANSITADKLIVSSALNLIPGADDLGASRAAFPNANGWGFNSGDPSVWLQGRTDGYSAPFALNAGDKVRISVNIRTNVAGSTAAVGLIRGGSFATGALWITPYAAPGSSFGTYEGVIEVPQTRSDYSFAVRAQWSTANQNPTGYQWFQHPRVQKMAGATIIEDGAITSPKITADELTGLDIVGSKFRLLGEDGSEAVVLAPGTANFAVFGSADKHVAISSDGQISADHGSFENITYAGDPLSTLLSDSGKGVVYDAQFTLPSDSYNSTQYMSLFGAQFELEAGRRYMVVCDTGGNLLAYKQGTSMTLNADIRCMPTTGLPGLNDLTTGRIYWDQQQSTRDMDRIFDFTRVYNVRSETTQANMHNLLPGLNSIRAKIWRSSGTASWGFTARGSAGRFTVIDVGPALDEYLPSITDHRTAGSGGGDNDGNTGGARNYTKTYNATWSQSYLGSGSQRPDGTKHLYQGYTSYYPGGGTQRSQIGFNDAQIRSDLSGATVQSVEVYVFYEHWWSGAGGNARIGTHSNSNKPGSFTGANTAYYTDSNNWPRAAGRWVKLNSAEGDRFKSGTARGITLNAYSTGNLYYGYARGVGQSYAPKLRIKYRK